MPNEAGPRRGDRDGPVLEREGRVAGVVLEPEVVDAEGRAQPVCADERRRADRAGHGPAARRRAGARGSARCPAAGPRSPRGSPAPRTTPVVVRDLERAEARGADIGRADRLGPPTVATDEADDARRGHDRAARVVGGRLGRWCGRGRRSSSSAPRLGGRLGRRDRSGNEKTLPAAEGSQGVPLSRRRTCPDLAPCRLDAGRLSWLHRAGPSATLDKSSSVVWGSYGPKACGVNATGLPGPRLRAARPITASYRIRMNKHGPCCPDCILGRWARTVVRI